MSQDLVEARKRLRVLGIVQLATYVALGIGIFIEELIHAQNMSPYEGSGYGYYRFDPLFLYQGAASTSMQTYLLGALTLVPSTIILILEPKKQNPKNLKIARGLQLSLFISVCLALLPALAFIVIQGSKLLSVACLVGIIFYPIMLKLVQKAIPVQVQYVNVQPTPPVETKAQSLENAVFCPNCGSPLSADGKCSTCA